MSEKEKTPIEKLLGEQLEEIKEDAYLRGRSDGYGAGYDDGYRCGRDDGYDAGLQAGGNK
jgi:flagellar biosynthesis/type III secretory pathway protein FliH